MADRHIIRRFLTELLGRVQGNIKSAEDLDTAVCWAIWKLDSLIGIKELEVLYEFQTQEGVLAQVINVAPYFIAQVREVREKTCGYNLKFWKEYMSFDINKAPKGAPRYYWFDPPLISENLNYYVGYAHQMLTMWLYPVPDRQYTLEILMKVLPLTLQDAQDSILPAVFEKYYVPLFYLATAELFRLNQMYQEAEREENEALKIATIYKKMFAPPTPSIIPLKYQLFKRKSDVPCSFRVASSGNGGSGNGGSGDGGSGDGGSGDGGDYVILTLYFDPLQGDVSRMPAGEMIATNQIRYPRNTSVQLTPVPYPPREFYYWTMNGDVNFYSPLNIVMDTNKIVEALFTNNWEKVLVFEYGDEQVGEIFLQFGSSGSSILPPSIYPILQGTFVSIHAQNIPDTHIFEKYEFYERNPDGTIGNLIDVISSQSYTFQVNRSYLIKFFVRQSITYQLSILITNWNFITGDQIVRNPLGETIYEGLYKYPAGTSVSLVPFPLSGNSFVYWRYPVWTESGQIEVVSDEFPLVLIMDRNKYAEGIFIGPSGKVIKIAHGNDPIGDVRIHYYIDGSAWVDHLIPASNLPWWEIVGNDTVITLTAENLLPNYRLEKWKVYERNPDGTQGAFLFETDQNPISIVVDTGKIIYKYITPAIYTLTIEWGGIRANPFSLYINDVFQAKFYFPHTFQIQYGNNIRVEYDQENPEFMLDKFELYEGSVLTQTVQASWILNPNPPLTFTLTENSRVVIYELRTWTFDFRIGNLPSGELKIFIVDYIENFSKVLYAPAVQYVPRGRTYDIRAYVENQQVPVIFQRLDIYLRNPDGSKGVLIQTITGNPDLLNFNPTNDYIFEYFYSTLTGLTLIWGAQMVGGIMIRDATGLLRIFYSGMSGISLNLPPGNTTFTAVQIPPGYTFQKFELYENNVLVFTTTNTSFSYNLQEGMVYTLKFYVV